MSFPCSVRDGLWSCGHDGCGKQIPTSKKSLIAYHKNTHAPKYKCETCAALFPQKHALETHVRIAHTGEKPFACSHCERSFPQMSNLQDHVRKTHPEKAPRIVQIKPRPNRSDKALKREVPGPQGSGVSTSHIAQVTADQTWVDLIKEIDVLLSGDVGGCQLDHCARGCGAEALDHVVGEAEASNKQN